MAVSPKKNEATEDGEVNHSKDKWRGELRRRQRGRRKKVSSKAKIQMPSMRDFIIGALKLISG